MVDSSSKVGNVQNHSETFCHMKQQKAIKDFYGHIKKPQEPTEEVRTGQRNNVSFYKEYDLQQIETPKNI